LCNSKSLAPTFPCTQTPVIPCFFTQDCALGISLPQAYKWLELSIHFYVSCATAHNFLSENSDTQHSIIDTSIVAEVLDGNGPWVALYELFYLTAKKCGWAEICRIHDRLDPKKYRYEPWDSHPGGERHDQIKRLEVLVGKI